MAAWHRRYNVSGTIHCGQSVEDWCRVLRIALRTNDVVTIGHYTGALSVFASSTIADIASCGFAVHDFWALAHGERTNWLAFAVSLESALATLEMPYSLVVHEMILFLEEVSGCSPRGLIAMLTARTRLHA
jgi:hypothetical protein